MTKKAIREKFRTEVFERDEHKCVVCETTESLTAHHITDRNEMPNGGYVKENGITLCEKDHKKAEVWHESNNEVFEQGFHPEDLYQKIHSSYEDAIEKSKSLC
jgi:5-methylcytosine-specific restriction endonuclease McrA